MATSVPQTVRYSLDTHSKNVSCSVFTLFQVFAACHGRLASQFVDMVVMPVKDMYRLIIALRRKRAMISLNWHLGIENVVEHLFLICYFKNGYRYLFNTDSTFIIKALAWWTVLCLVIWWHWPIYPEICEHFTHSLDNNRLTVNSGRSCWFPCALPWVLSQVNNVNTNTTWCCGKIRSVLC